MLNKAAFIYNCDRVTELVYFGILSMSADQRDQKFACIDKCAGGVSTQQGWVM